MALGGMGGLNRPQQQGGSDWLKAIEEILAGPEGRTEGFDLYNPNQQQAFAQILQQALSGLSSNPSDFAPIEQQAREGFTQQTIPSIMERFTGLGAQGSSAFGNRLGAAGAGLESNLAALRSSHGLQRQQLLQNLASLGLTPQQHVQHTPQQPGLLHRLFSDPATLGAVGSTVGSFFGPIGTAAGGLIGSGIGGISKLFNAPKQKFPQANILGNIRNLIPQGPTNQQMYNAQNSMNLLPGNLNLNPTI